MTAYVGVDWGFGHSQVWAVVDDEVVLDRRVSSRPEALSEMIGEVSSHVEHPSDVFVGIEKATGLVVEQLIEAGWMVYNINPAKVEAGRMLVSMSGAKDDRRDARVLAKLVHSFRDELVPLVPMGPLARGLRHVGRHRSALLKDRTRVLNRLSAVLREWFPAMLEVGDLRTQWQLELVAQVPHPGIARGLKVNDLRTILAGTRCSKSPAALLKVLHRPAPPARQEVYDALEFEVKLWVEQLKMLTRQLSQVHQRSLALLAELDKEEAPGTEDRPTDLEVVLSMPAIGKKTAVVLFGEGLTDLLRDNLQAARCVAGVAPVTAATGKRQTAARPTVKMRRACNGFVRDALHNAVMAGVGNHPELRHRYRRRRDRGMTEGAACRAEADRMLRILHAMLRDGTLYEKPAPTNHTVAMS